MTDEQRRARQWIEMTNRMLRAWSPALRDRIMNIYVAAIDERRPVDREDLIVALGFDPCDVDNLKPPWRNPDFE